MTNGFCRSVAAPSHGATFDDVILPHRDAAYRLARWLLRNEDDAEDVVQEALLRALRYFRTFTGGNGRAWFLRIVRNTCSGWRSRSFATPTDPFDEEEHAAAGPATDPEALLLHADDVTLVERAMRALPNRSRAVLALRELDGLSYREVAEAMDMPIGTVMSSLWRARRAFRGAVDMELKRPGVRRIRRSSTSGNQRTVAPDQVDLLAAGGEGR